jgi:hypothetical protein
MIIDTNQIVALDKALVNLMSQQTMILLRDHNYKISQSLNYKSDRPITSKQNFVDLMTQHRIEEFCSVKNTKSSNLELLLEQLSATSTKLLGQ